MNFQKVHKATNMQEKNMSNRLNHFNISSKSLGLPMDRLFSKHYIKIQKISNIKNINSIETMILREKDI